MIRKLLQVSFLTCALGAVTGADILGKPLPAVELEGLTQSPANRFEELSGRAVLIEFFAYW